MLKSQKIHLPYKDDLTIPLSEDDLFSIRLSENALVVTLNKFGYKGIHITIYIKDIDVLNNTFTLNAHLTKEGVSGEQNEQLLKFERKIDIKKIESYFKDKEEKIVKIYLNHCNSIKTEYDPKKIVCCQCVGAELDLNFKKKHLALKSYQELINFKFTPDLIKKYSSCQHKKHNPFIHTEKELLLYKFGDKYCTEEQAKKYTDQMKEVFSEMYAALEKELSPIKKEFERVMTEYKMD